jgi:phage terminase large subunit
MIQKVNKKYAPLFKENWRYAVLMGGRAGGRSFVASQYALSKLIAPEYFRCAIMRFVLGDIRNSIYQEIIDRAEEQGIRENLTIKEHPSLLVEYGANRINGIGFRKSSSDQTAKLKSLANYNCVIIEEADEVAEEDFQQLDDSLRTLKSDIRIILCLNPPYKNHWIVKRFFNLVDTGIEGFYEAKLKSLDNCIYLHTTYRDNLINLNQSTIENFKRYKETNPEHYYNMIEGLISEGQRGRIYKNWIPITEQEYEKLEYTPYYGLDFGFSNSETGLVEIKEHNQNVYVKELIYKTGLTNQMIAEEMERLGVSKDAYIYADSAEPKSIEELKVLDWNVVPASKGEDSVRTGISLLKERKVHYTENSKNIQLEIQNYKWQLGRDKEPTNKPIDSYNHLCDAIRYGVYTKSKKIKIGIEWI